MMRRVSVRNRVGLGIKVLTEQKKNGNPTPNPPIFMPPANATDNRECPMRVPVDSNMDTREYILGIRDRSDNIEVTSDCIAAPNPKPRHRSSSAVRIQ